MILSLTRLRLRSARYLPSFWLATLASLRQLRISPGYLQGCALIDRNRTYWTVTLWTDAEAMKAYILSGGHRKAMAKVATWCDEATAISIPHSAVTLPDWDSVHKTLSTTGKITKVRYPTDAQKRREFSPPIVSMLRILRIKPRAVRPPR